MLAAGHDHGVIAAGLGARDTLRLEAAMPLYGHELNEEINPIEAGLNFAVNLDGRWFPGCERLEKIKREGPKRVRIGLELSGKRARGTLRNLRRRPVDWRGHERYIFADARKTHRHGLRAAAVRHDGNEVGNRYPRKPRTGDGRDNAVLPTSKKQLRTEPLINADQR